LKITKKAAVIATAAVAAVAVAGGAWAYIVTTGSGSGTATATADSGSVVFTASAAITDLATPADITINGTSTKANRHVGALALAVTAAPPGCNVSWFQITGPGAYTGHTFAGTSSEPVSNGDYKITLLEEDADQSSCLTGNITFTVNTA
jgi:hypothetical protein